MPVEVQSLRRAAMVAVYSGTAPIEAHEEAEVVAKVGGEVRQIYVEEGDPVKAGQVLARLDGDRLRLEVAAVGSQPAQARARLQAPAGARREGTRRQGHGRERQVRSRRAAGRATTAHASNLSYTEIRAPIAGVVSARHIKVGNTISPNDPTFRVTDLDPLIAYVHVPEREFPKLAAPSRRPTSSSTRSAARRFPGTIARISPTVDPQTGTFRAEHRSPRSVAAAQARHVRARQHRLRASRERAAAAAQRHRSMPTATQSVFVIVKATRPSSATSRTGLTNGGMVEVTRRSQGRRAGRRRRSGRSEDGHGRARRRSRCGCRRTCATPRRADRLQARRTVGDTT